MATPVEWEIPRCASATPYPLSPRGRASSAADILGISEVHLLDYQDTRLAEAPIDQIRGELVALIRRHRPHVVITFDPNGMNGHADHVAISRFTMDAVAAAADPRWASEPTTPHLVVSKNSIRAVRHRDSTSVKPPPSWSRGRTVQEPDRRRPTG